MALRNFAMFCKNDSYITDLWSHQAERNWHKKTCLCGGDNGWLLWLPSNHEWVGWWCWCSLHLWRKLLYYRFESKCFACQENLHLKMLSVYVLCWIFLQTFQTYFCIQANSLDPDQTAPGGAVWSGSILFAKMTFKITSRWQSRWQLWLAV